ncbi:hypothetical protein [Streptomyces sp. NPDC003393]
MFRGPDVLGGAVQFTGGIGDHGLSKEMICDGFTIDSEQEEEGTTVMHGDDRCFPLESGDEYRTYAQQRDLQQGRHQDVVVGAW